MTDKELMQEWQTACENHKKGLITDEDLYLHGALLMSHAKVRGIIDMYTKAAFVLRGEVKDELGMPS